MDIISIQTHLPLSNNLLYPWPMFAVREDSSTISTCLTTPSDKIQICKTVIEFQANNFVLKFPPCHRDCYRCHVLLHPLKFQDAGISGYSNMCIRCPVTTYFALGLCLLFRGFWQLFDISKWYKTSLQTSTKLLWNIFVTAAKNSGEHLLIILYATARAPASRGQWLLSEHGLGET